MSDNFDWKSLHDVVNTKRTQYDFNKYQKYFKKIAIDRYKALNGSDQMWELRAGDDGNEYLFALYGEPEDVVTGSSETTKDFQAQADSEGDSVTLAYRKTPIFRFAKTTYHFPDGAAKFADYIEDKAQDEKWLKSLFSKAMSKERRASIQKLIQGV